MRPGETGGYGRLGSLAGSTIPYVVRPHDRIAWRFIRSLPSNSLLLNRVHPRENAWIARHDRNLVNLKRRSAAAVFWLPIITLGIYSIVWYARTRGDMRRSGAKPMSTWWLLVPFAFFWYYWSLSKAIEKVTGASKGANYALLLLLGWIGQAFVQARINRRVRAALAGLPANQA